jgi:cell wall-associated NlpC family hydrolase
VRALYRDGPAELTVTAAAFDGRWEIEEIADTWRAARVVVDDDARTVDRARGLTDRSLATSRAMEDARRDRAAAEEAARAERDAVEAALRAHEAVLAGAEADLAAAVEREREEAETLALAWAVGSTAPIDEAAALAVVSGAAASAPSAAAAAAVSAAATRLGSPYTWGATGPGTFDCSGLVLWAYARAGIAVPRTSRQQHAGLTPVSLDSLLPGDLVFYASGPDAGSIHHVGLVVGQGLMIHAPRTGDVVRIAAVDRRPPFAAVRPAPADI